MMKIRQDNDMSDHTSMVNVENKSKLSWSIGPGCHLWQKTRQDNDVIDYTMVRYTENDTKLSLLIRSGVDYDKNQIR